MASKRTEAVPREVEKSAAEGGRHEGPGWEGGATGMKWKPDCSFWAAPEVVIRHGRHVHLDHLQRGIPHRGELGEVGRLGRRLPVLGSVLARDVEVKEEL